MTERLHFHFSLSCIGVGNGNPLQYSCLENPRDGGAWWAAVYGVAQSQTRLKRLSSSSSRVEKCNKVYLIKSCWCFLLDLQKVSGAPEVKNLSSNAGDVDSVQSLVMEL